MQAQALAAARLSIFFLMFLIGGRGDPAIELSETPGNSPAFQCRFLGGEGGALSAGTFFGAEDTPGGEDEELEDFLLGRERIAQKQILEGRTSAILSSFHGNGRTEAEKEMEEAVAIIDS